MWWCSVGCEAVVIGLPFTLVTGSSDGEPASRQESPDFCRRPNPTPENRACAGNKGAFQSIPGGRVLGRGGGGGSALGQAHEHGPVQDVHVLAGDLGFVPLAGAQGCHERDVVAV